MTLDAAHSCKCGADDAHTKMVSPPARCPAWPACAADSSMTARRSRSEAPLRGSSRSAFASDIVRLAHDECLSVGLPSSGGLRLAAKAGQETPRTDMQRLRRYGHHRAPEQDLVDRTRHRCTARSSSRRIVSRRSSCSCSALPGPVFWVVASRRRRPASTPFLAEQAGKGRTIALRRALARRLPLPPRAALRGCPAHRR